MTGDIQIAPWVWFFLFLKSPQYAHVQGLVRSGCWGVLLVCMGMCVYVCVYKYTRMCVHVCVHVCVRMCTCVCVRACYLCLEKQEIQDLYQHHIPGCPAS